MEIDEVYKWLLHLTVPEWQDYINAARMYIGAFEQIEWERNIAIQQLQDLGYELGEEIRKECA